MMKIAVTTSSFGKYDKKPLRLLEDRGIEVLLNSYGRKLKKEEAIEICKDATGIIAGTETLDRDVMMQLKKVRVISRCGVGLDSLDLNAAKELDIKVFNTPDGPTIAVAELTIGLILNLLRKISLMDFGLKTSGTWKKLMGNLLAGKNIGIVGFGRIGRKVAELLKALGCIIRYADPFLEDGIMGFKQASLDDLLSWSDIVLIHVSSGKEIIGKKEIELMKQGSYLLNISRGGVVNEDVLYNALASGQLSGAALDVFKEEPYKGPLKKLDNVILTPHIGSYAIEARVEMEKQAVENLLKGLG
ncbi:phosphoglycerate dehydrogenase [Candidatus Omnitrophota bacterium]